MSQQVAHRSRREHERPVGGKPAEGPHALSANGEKDQMIEFVDRFLWESAGRWSANTMERYSRRLQDLAGWLQAQGIRDPAAITPELLLRWLDGHPSWGPSTRHVAIAALRVFFRWAVGEANSPAGKVPYPKRPTTSSRRSLRDDEALKLLAVPDTSTVKGIRDLAIVALLLDTGLRNSELCGLLLENLHLEDRALQAVIKGGRWAWAVFSSYTASTLEDWLSIRPVVARPGVPQVFISLGGASAGKRLGRGGLALIVRRLAERAGLGRITPHELRHSFAELSLLAGAPTRITQKGGRWKDLRQVERYTQRIELEAFRPYSPVNYVMGIPPERRRPGRAGRVWGTDR